MFMENAKIKDKQQMKVIISLELRETRTLLSANIKTDRTLQSRTQE